MVKISYRTVIRTKTEIFVGILNEQFQKFKKSIAGSGTRTHFIVDAGIPENLSLYALESLLEKSDDYEIYRLSPGEDSKNAEVVLNLCREIVIKGVKRSDLVVVIGGGAVCDAGNFAASLLLRGLNSVLVPTTLLSMVDAAIGGKTAVNVDSIKNQLGTFHQPRAIFVDPEFLKGLPESEIKNGLGEVIKTLFLSGEEDELFKDRDGIVNKRILERCIRYKARVVRNDPIEIRGKREFLNFGHTIGHALEASSQGAVNHGTAVALSLYWEQKMAEALFPEKITSDISQKIGRILDYYGYNLNIIKEYDFLPFIRYDKKIKEESHIRFVYLRSKGKPAVARVEKEIFENTIKELMWK
jgi:3-dehydroquinate synthase